MGLQSAMTTALTGLQGAETVIDVVGNNVANSGTVGFKESDVLFATQFLQTQSIGSAPSADRGGTNPRQIGLGVKVAAINPDFRQGTIQISSNPLDLAIQGDGFLIVQGAEGEQFYTRNGQIQTNNNNELVTVTGNRVLGFNVDEDFNMVEELTPLRIPLGEEPVTQPTENAFFSGVLTPLADVGDTPGIIASEVLGDDTLPFPNDPDFNLGDFTTLAAPGVGASASALNGAGGVPPGTYDYRVVFFANTGTPTSTFQGPPSVSFGSVTVPAGPDQEISLTGLPVDSASIWDGRYLYRRQGTGDYELVATLDATTATYDDNAATGTTVLDDDSLDQGNYSYYVTYYNTNDGTESRPTARIGSLAIADTNGRIRIDNLPVPDGTNFNAIRIYRNLATNSSEFHLVTTLENDETTYIDNSPDADIEPNALIDLIGPKATNGTALVDVVVRDGESYTNPFEEGVLNFTGRRGGRSLDTKSLTITSTTTVQELISFMQDSFGISDIDDPFPETSGGSITGGVIQFVSNMGVANSVSVGLSSFSLTPTGETESTPVSLSFTETQEANGEGSTTDFVVFDSLGTPISVRITTVMEDKNDNSTIYRWFATSGDNEPTIGVSTFLGSGLIEFDGNGAIENGRTATIAVQRNLSASESPLEFVLNFSQVSGLALQNNLGQSNSSMNMIRQDGFPPGTLTSFIITESGLIRGVFSNGAERPLGQIRMARFANNVGLQQVGENLFAVGVNSGDPLQDNPGENGLGSLTAGALELSNTDIGRNLIELILASTQYRGGARVITTAQQLLDELLNLRR